MVCWSARVPYASDADRPSRAPNTRDAWGIYIFNESLCPVAGFLNFQFFTVGVNMGVVVNLAWWGASVASDRSVNGGISVYGVSWFYCHVWLEILY